MWRNDPLVWLFDLDNTLYPPRAGVMDVLDGRIRDYMTSRVHIPLREVDRARREYCAGYGSCVEGLRREYAVDADDFLTAVHDFDVTRYLRPDPALRQFLLALAAPKFIFTNAPEEYARRVLNALDIADLFERIFDIRFLEFQGKPNSRAYCRVLAALNTWGECCAFVEDSPRNFARPRFWACARS
jgi:putative hydrolase of the HAD superfamily